MDEVINSVINAGRIPTRQDITDLLTSIAPPGQKLEEKQAAVLRLFQEAGHNHENSQGHSVVSTLDGYEAY